MGLVITNGDTREKWELTCGAVFWYRPCGWGEWQEIRRQNVDEKGLIVNSVGVTKTLLQRKVISWEHVVNETGEPVEFSHEDLFKLPPIIIDELEKLILLPVTKEAEQQGNSDGSSGT